MAALNVGALQLSLGMCDAAAPSADDHAQRESAELTRRHKRRCPQPTLWIARVSCAVQLGYAFESGDVDEMVAQGLAWSATAYATLPAQPPGAPTPPPLRMTPEAALAALQRDPHPFPRYRQQARVALTLKNAPLIQSTQSLVCSTQSLGTECSAYSVGYAPAATLVRGMSQAGR